MKNVGGIDKVVRGVAGLALLGAFAVDQSNWWGLIGIVPLVTAAMGWCPLYRVFGMNTGHKSREQT